jgi:hypothetical protein
MRKEPDPEGARGNQKKLSADGGLISRGFDVAEMPGEVT